MEITCPRCETVFALPDELFSPGKKARCSNCGMIFPMQEASVAAPGTAAVAAPAGKFARLRKPLLISVVCLLLLGGMAAGGWWVASNFFSDTSATEGDLASVEGQDQAGNPQDGAGQPGRDAADAAEQSAVIRDIAIENLRQFTVNNPAIGALVVMEGNVVNTSRQNKANITVEAWLADEKGTVLVHQKQLCGISVPLYQLQSMNEGHLREALNNRVQLLSNNTNVRPGARIPFTVIFASPPQNMHSFHLRVIHADKSEIQDSPKAPAAAH